MPQDNRFEFPVQPARSGSGRRRRAIVICTHLRPSRTRRNSRHFMQPLTGVHIGSLIDPSQFEIMLHHEDWHGPLNPAQAHGYDIVFLTGLQADFDRMRQLAFHFRRAGAVVVAGGSIATMFPEFATEFFDVVCAGGVENVRQVVADFLDGRLQRIYRSPIARIGDYKLDYGLLTRNRIRLRMHLVEGSRGCSFRCKFCVMPAEVGGHAPYDLGCLRQAIDNAIETSPAFSLRRLWPTLLFFDNNFSDDRGHMLAVAELLRTHPKVRGWAALVTQNVLRDHALIARLVASKCRALFVGLESLDPEFLRRFQKKQNLGRDNVVDDIAAAEAAGLVIVYGYLFDPRYQTVAQMSAQLQLIASTDALSLPVYLSLVAPLVGTEMFWEDLAAGRLAANLRLRDLDGETIAYAKLADAQEQVARFVGELFHRPVNIVGRGAFVRKLARRALGARSSNPLEWYFRAAPSLRFSAVATDPSRRRSHLAGEDVLDPQYYEYPADISKADWQRYFEPVAVTDAAGQPADWLLPYLERRSRRASAT